MPDPTTSSDLAALVAAWSGVDRDRWTAVEYVRRGRAFIDAHALLHAQEILRAGLERWPDDVPLRQAMALAWSRSEAAEEAAEILAGLVSQGCDDVETLGLLAAARKKIGLAAGDRGTAQLRESLALYATAYRRDRAVWHGINAATLALLLGDEARARDTAADVIGVCREKLAAPGADRDYWLAATMAEACLVLGDLAGTEEWSRRARGLVGGRFGRLDTTRRQFAALLHHAGRDRTLVDGWLPMPGVVVFAGHMVDLPDRPAPRFPADRCDAVAAAIRSWLRGRDAGFGFSSAACGGDILFQETLADLGAERCVVLPFPEEMFLGTSVDRAGGASWAARFTAVLAGAPRVVRASRTPLRHPELSYEYANQLILGLARSRAQQLGATLEALVVWDGRPGDGGGTSSVVGTCRRLGIPVHVIDPMQAGRVEARECAPLERVDTAATAAVAGDRWLGAVMFADALGFSKLPDEQVPLFVEKFLGRIATVVDRYGPERITVRETWGDGLFFAFPRLADAALFSLDVAELVNGTDWQAEGFSTPLKLRTALHHGPMYPGHDPITGRASVCGAHIAHAARLEPKTPPGQVYATEAFAARAALEGHPSFRCTFVRQLEFDKRFGTFPTYVVSRAAASQRP